METPRQTDSFPRLISTRLHMDICEGLLKTGSLLRRCVCGTPGTASARKLPFLSSFRLVPLVSSPSLELRRQNEAFNLSSRDACGSPLQGLQSEGRRSPLHHEVILLQSRTPRDVPLLAWLVKLLQNVRDSTGKHSPRKGRWSRSCPGRVAESSVNSWDGTKTA